MAKQTYADFLKQDFKQLFDALNLDDIQRHYLRSRWLDQVIWMEKKAAFCRDWYYRLRLTAITLGIIVPILLGLEFTNPRASQVKKYLAIGLSGVVAVSAAIEEFFHYGERWYHYRRTVESLKTHGWQFSQLSGQYSDYDTCKAAFDDFTDQIEELIQRDVEIYVTQIAQQDKTQKSQQKQSKLPREQT
ncbi:uncharacterized protein XM38_028120 [Halomicronema hongdechloris C2206]|uniref:DUF4231 domain-containing protein n=1 Tax=Halomicronema hongdechloris C2206 TaxID=1641165 RepID=A0A1Z3HNG8_9CYAN|nr:DUF4231 domain-containing protein [Halomicronema hongdechloris]ASC71858.1 uncharacterized protein XM38_028120 [Halomicronema hongdechloris C2206]